MGLEVTGNILGENFELGDDVIALLPGCGYAQYVAVNKGHIIKKPKSMCWEEVFILLTIHVKQNRRQVQQKRI
jgi:NADPH:quinone reductase-like Zn-dependent oxidoreductase